jgi:hypothetical protein
MCNGFGMIITKDKKFYFCEQDYGDEDMSHSKILQRAPIKENNNPFIRHFVRVECGNWDMESFRFDEEETLPTWVEEERESIWLVTSAILSKVAPLYFDYRKKNQKYRAFRNKLEDGLYVFTDRINKDGRVHLITNIENKIYKILRKISKAMYRQYVKKLSQIKGYIPELV